MDPTIGAAARDKFLRTLNRHGGPISVIRNFHHKDEARMRVDRALYQRAGGETEFQVAEIRDMIEGDHIQQIGSRDVYRVRKCEARFVEGVAVSYVAAVSQVTDSTRIVSRA